MCIQYLVQVKKVSNAEILRHFRDNYIIMCTFADLGFKQYNNMSWRVALHFIFWFAILFYVRMLLQIM